MKKLVLFLVALCLVVGMSGAAEAQTMYSLNINWAPEDPLDDEINEVVIQFLGSGGQVLTETTLLYAFTIGFISTWQRAISPNSQAVTVRWFIDSNGLNFDPIEQEVPLPQNNFNTVYEP